METTLTPEKVVGAFFEGDKDTHIWLHKLNEALNADDANSVLCEQIEKRVSEEVAAGKAVKTIGNIGDDGAGLDFLLEVRNKANKESKIHYHFDNAILRHLPSFKGKRVEVV